MRAVSTPSAGWASIFSGAGVGGQGGAVGELALTAARRLAGGLSGLSVGDELPAAASR
jgi:hypothetical protein